MCIVSNIYDDFSKRFPNYIVEQPTYTWPLGTITIPNTGPMPPYEPINTEEVQKLTEEIANLRKYIDEFRESVELAKRLDVLMK